MKRGQVTIFIILAVVILIIVALVSYYSRDISNYNVKDLALPNDVRDYKENVKSCVDSITEDSIRLVSFRGGYFTLPSENFEELTAYYYISGQSSLPTLDLIGSEIKEYVDSNIQNCLQESDKLSIEVTDKEISVDITEDSVNFNIIYNIKLTFKDKEYILNNPYKKVVVLPLKKMHSISSQIIKIQEQDPENICYSCILQIAEENNVEITLNSLSNSLLFTIEKEGYTFNFATKY